MNVAYIDNETHLQLCYIRFGRCAICGRGSEAFWLRM